MKSLKEYMEETSISAPMGDVMKPKIIMAEQNNGKDALWNSSEDRWSRKAKHQLPTSSRVSFEEAWQLGDTAIYENKEVEITIPKGPNSTVGIIVDGEIKMVRESSLKRIDEGVFGGMQSLSPINRMMQLAGLAVPTTISPTYEQINNEDVAITIEEADATNMFDGLFKANVSGEFKNNPPAARLATIGQILVSLNSQVGELGDEIDTGTKTKLNAALGIGAAMISAARNMINPQTGE